MKRVIDNLYWRAKDPGDPSDPAIEAISTILGLSGVDLTDPADPSGASKKIDPTDHIGTWPAPFSDKVLGALVQKYAEVLDLIIEIDGGRVDLVWDIIKVDEVYNDPSILPDAEHRLLVLLIEEGVFREMMTTNWDPLVERAFEQSKAKGDGADLAVIVAPTDIIDVGDAPRLIKMHGCAKRAAADPDARKYVVARESEIEAWIANHDFDAVRTELQGIAARKGILYLGLSGQDINIRQQHLQTILTPPNEVDPARPRVLFAEEGGLNQTAIKVLRAAYGPKTYLDNHHALDATAIVPLFAKPLLGGLFTSALLTKLRSFADRLPEAAHVALAHRGIDALLGRVKDAVDSIADADQRWRFVSDAVAQYVSSFVQVYRHAAPLGGRWVYHPVSRAMDLQPSMDDAQLALLVGILVEGQAAGRWSFSFTPFSAEQLSVTISGVTTPIFLICDRSMSPELDTLIPPSPGVPRLVIHARGSEPQSRRTGLPSTSLSIRTSPPAQYDLYLEDIVEGQPDPVEAFHKALSKYPLTRTAA